MEKYDIKLICEILSDLEKLTILMFVTGFCSGIFVALVSLSFKSKKPKEKKIKTRPALSQSDFEGFKKSLEDYIEKLGDTANLK